MERNRERAFNSRSLKNDFPFGERNVMGTIHMKDGRWYKFDDRIVRGEAVHFIQSYGDHPVRTVPLQDVTVIDDTPEGGRSGEVKFDRSAKS